jgi:hypothetical protein
VKAFAIIVQILAAPIAVITGMAALAELLGRSESLKGQLYFGVAFLFLMLGCILQTLVSFRQASVAAKFTARRRELSN